jgi:hypothetical protein
MRAAGAVLRQTDEALEPIDEAEDVCDEMIDKGDEAEFEDAAE